MHFPVLDRLPDMWLGLLDPYWAWAIGAMIFGLTLTGLAPLTHDTSMSSHQIAKLFIRKTMLVIIGALILLLPAFWGVAAGEFGQAAATDLALAFLGAWWAFFMAALIMGSLLRIGWRRYGEPRLSNLARALRIEQDTEKVSDMRDELGKYNALDYDPRDYFKEGEMFTGLAQDGSPLYIPLKVWAEIHKTVAGATRFGKGILYQIWLFQAILLNWTIFVIDPKKDKFIVHVMALACKAAGRKMIVLDLEDETSPGQWSPFCGGATKDRRIRFNNIFELDNRGTDADHYKGLSREQMMELFATGKTRLKELLEGVEDRCKQKTDEADALKGVRASLREWTAYSKLCPRPGRGFSIEKSLLNNAVVLVRGSLHDNVVRNATVAFIMELTQECMRLSSDRKTHVVLAIDELRFLISRVVLDALATIAGYDVEIWTAYQSFTDLTNPIDTRLVGHAVKQSVMINSQIKLAFGGTDGESAEEIADTTGQRLKRVVKFEKTEVNTAGGEKWSTQRTVGDEPEFVVPENVIKALPPRVGVLLRPSELASIMAVSPVPVTMTEWEGHPSPAPQKDTSTVPTTP